MTLTKAERQRAILEMVRSRPIRTQDELVDALHARRLDVTQATVSRDVRELGLVRVADPDGPRYVAASAAAATAVEPEAPPATRLRGVFREHVRGIEVVEVLGVVRCRPSTAPLVAAALDAARLEEVAGTVAGDDTVLVVARGRAAARTLGRRLALLWRGEPRAAGDPPPGPAGAGADDPARGPAGAGADDPARGPAGNGAGPPARGTRLAASRR